MRVKIEIDTKTFIRFWLVVIGFGLVGIAIWLAKDALILLGVAAFLALALNQPVSKITQILPGSKKNRVGATAVAYLLIVAILGVFVMFVMPVIIEQTGKFAATVPDFVQNLTAENSGVRQFVEKNNLQPMVKEATDSASRFASTFAQNIGGIFFGGINAVANLIFSTIMVLTMAFFMLVEGPAWLGKLWSLYPDKSRMRRHKRIADRMYRAVSGFVNGQMTVSAIGGVATSMGVLALVPTMGVPMSLVIPVGVILFFLNMIPMFGVMIGVAISAVLVAMNSLPAGVAFLLYSMVYQQIEGNVISPMIQAKNNNLSPALVLAAILIGVYIFGLLGALISIPIAACAKILLEEYFAVKNKTPEAETDFSEIVKKLG